MKAALTRSTSSPSAANVDPALGNSRITVPNHWVS